MSEEEKIDPALETLFQEINEAEGMVEKSAPKSEDKSEDTADEVGDEQDGSQNDEQEELQEQVEQEPSHDLDLEENDIDDDDEDEDDGLDNIEVIAAKPMSEHEAKMQNIVVGLVEKHSHSVEKMFDEADTDRKRIDDVLGVLMTKIESDEYRGADIGALASLIQTKADISRNRASMMDSIAKLFASIKNNDSVGVNGKADDDSIDQDDIERLLNGGD